MSSITGTPATWVVVGASRGIGLEYVKQLLQAGNRVIATARNPDASGLSAVVKSHGNPEDCIIEQCDVASSESIDVSPTCPSKPFILHMSNSFIHRTLLLEWPRL